jgi:hypothetical protein
VERHRQSLIAEHSLLRSHRTVSSTVLVNTVNTYVLVKGEICQRDQRYWPTPYERVEVPAQSLRQPCDAGISRRQLAAALSGHNYLGIELKEKYCNLDALNGIHRFVRQGTRVAAGLFDLFSARPGRSGTDPGWRTLGGSAGQARTLPLALAFWNIEIMLLCGKR